MQLCGVEGGRGHDEEKGTANEEKSTAGAAESGGEKCSEIRGWLRKVNTHALCKL